MGFRQLKYISTVAEHKSITKAAKALYISQPSLSHYILKVENELGVKLFDRSTSPLTLTYAGEKYIETAQQILQLDDNLTKTFRDVSNNLKGRIRIGLPKERAAFMLPEIFPPFKEKFPDIDVQVFTANSKTLIALLKKGHVDFVFSPYGVEDVNIQSELIYKEELLLVASEGILTPDHCIATCLATVDLKKVKDFPFILLKNGHSIRESIDQIFNSASVTPNIFMETTSNITAFRMAASGMGLAIVPRMTIELVHSKNQTEVYSVSELPYVWEVNAYYCKDAYIGIPEKHLLEIARTIFSRYSFNNI